MASTQWVAVDDSEWTELAAGPGDVTVLLNTATATVEVARRTEAPAEAQGEGFPLNRSTPAAEFHGIAAADRIYARARVGQASLSVDA